MLKKYLRRGFLVLAIVGVVWGLILLKRCSDRVLNKPRLTIAPTPMVQKDYVPPVVKLPFTSDKQPISDKRLPIPASQVDKTIVVSTVDEKSRNIEIIIDKKGDVYVPTDTPPTTRVEVTKWKPSLFAADFRFGYSLVKTRNGFGHCLTLDYFRVGRFYLGSEIGAEVGERISPLIGLSLKYKFGSFGLFDQSRIDMLVTVGYNFTGQATYAGLTLKW